MFGTFTEEALSAYTEQVRAKAKSERVKSAQGTEWADNLEVSDTNHDFLDKQSYAKEDYSECYDFARCLRSDGSTYGTAGKCRKGTQTDTTAKEERESRLRETYGKAYLALDKLKQRRKRTKAGKKAEELDSRIEKLGRVLKTVGAAQSKVREENAKGKKRENFGKLPQWATEGRSLA
jgi:hypothetical protein